MGSVRYPGQCEHVHYNHKELHDPSADDQTLSPGYIRTAMTDGLLAERPDLEAEWLSGSMLNRLSTPDEFRGPVIFLLSQASSFMTGSDLTIDGGHTAF
jgi:NAD(P)-dependent dehydrogenase (short-subunit alcohol dehydrogenase family)